MFLFLNLGGTLIQQPHFSSSLSFRSGGMNSGAGTSKGNPEFPDSFSPLFTLCRRTQFLYWKPTRKEENENGGESTPGRFETQLDEGKRGDHRKEGRGKVEERRQRVPLTKTFGTISPTTHPLSPSLSFHTLFFSLPLIDRYSFPSLSSSSSLEKLPRISFHPLSNTKLSSSSTSESTSSTSLSFNKVETSFLTFYLFSLPPTISRSCIFTSLSQLTHSPSHPIPLFESISLIQTSHSIFRSPLVPFLLPPFLYSSKKNAR